MPVTADNYGRAATDLAFANIVKDGGSASSTHNRELTPIDKQLVVRQNRDTLYSAAVVDLDAGPVTVTLARRRRSLHVDAGLRRRPVHAPGDLQARALHDHAQGHRHALRRSSRCACWSIRTNPADLEAVHAKQDEAKIEQPGGPGTFDIPKWNLADYKKITDALTVLGDTLPDKNHMFGMKADVEPVRRLIGVATAWGGNPEKEATYLNFTPAQNDGKTIHRLVVKDVPVDGFWSVTVYDAKGFFQANPQNAYSFNNITAQKSPDGSIAIQFGGCDGKVPNCLPITPGWNYLVRLYRPQKEVLDGTWKFPEATPVQG